MSSSNSKYLPEEGVRRGSGGGAEGICRSSLDAREPHNPTKRREVPVTCSEPREPQNPTKGEEYQRHLQ
eukprot:953613-Prorocentrum_minimum.AAC.1